MEQKRKGHIMSTTPYHVPGKLSDRVIAQTQTETVGLTFGEACGNIKIVAIVNGSVIKQWTEGSGITVAQDRLSATYELSGADLIKGLDTKVRLEFAIWRDGVVAYTQDIKVVRSYV